MTIIQSSKPESKSYMCGFKQRACHAPPHERQKVGNVIEMENTRGIGGIPKTLRSHYHVLGTPLSHRNACEALKATLAEKRGYEGKNDTRNNKKALADAMEIERRKDLNWNNDERILQTLQLKMPPLQLILSRSLRQYTWPPPSNNLAAREIISSSYTQRCSLR